MLLPNIREKLGTISLRKKVFFILLGFFILVLLLITIEAIYCFNSLTCLFSLTRSSPTLGKLVGVEESSLVYSKGNYNYSKKMEYISVTGEIVRAENDGVVLRLKDGSEKEFSVKEGAVFLIYDSLPDEGLEGTEKVFNGNNLQEIVPGGDFSLFAQVDLSSLEIFSDYISKEEQRVVPIVIFGKI